MRQAFNSIGVGTAPYLVAPNDEGVFLWELLQLVLERMALPGLHDKGSESVVNERIGVKVNLPAAGDA